MYALVGVFGLIIFQYIRPQEFVPEIEPIPWVNLWLGLMVVGFIADLYTGRVQRRRTPVLSWVIALFAWCLFTLSLVQPGEMAVASTHLITCFSLSLIMQHAIQNMKTFVRAATVVFMSSMFCVTVAFHQGFQDPQCILLERNLEDPKMPPATIPDGRPCQVPRDCVEDAGAQEGAEYGCERAGLFGTSSIGGRVRWRGVLNDPNEITLAAGTSVPYAFAYFETRRTLLRLLLALSTVVIVAMTDIFSQSRGAILVLLTVLAVYFARKFGLRGLIIAAAVGGPLLMLGGRSGQEAAQSAEERMEVMADGLEMLRQNPLMGVGFGQFARHTFLTAHNAYVLASAELGIFGFWVWTVIIWTLMKSMVMAHRRYAGVRGGERVRAWSLALFASFCGSLVGVFFLSWTYHYVLWIYFGVAGSFYSTVRAADSGFDPRPGWKELLGLFVFDIAFMFVLRIYLRLKGH